MDGLATISAPCSVLRHVSRADIRRDPYPHVVVENCLPPDVYQALALAYPVEEIDSGCCGMAGSFGYEKEHYDISIAIGRRRLFPAVENNPNAVLVAPGISCRQQVEHATGRRPLHPAEALVRAL